MKMNRTQPVFLSQPHLKGKRTLSAQIALRYFGANRNGWACGWFLTNGSHLSGFQIVGLADIRSHLQSGPFANQPFLNHSKPRLVQISDPHNTLICVVLSGMLFRSQ